MKRSIALFLTSLFVLLYAHTVFAATPVITIDRKSGYNFENIKKVLVLPVIYMYKYPGETEFRQYYNFDFANSIKKAFVKTNTKDTMSVKTVIDAMRDFVSMNPAEIPYDWTRPETLTMEEADDYMDKVFSLGFDMVIQCALGFDLWSYQTQGYSLPYTTYNYTNVTSARTGGIVGYIQIPQQNYINVPPQEVVQFESACFLTFIDDTNNLGEVIKTQYSLKKRYQGGNINDALDSAIMDSMKKVFGKK